MQSWSSTFCIRGVVHTLRSNKNRLGSTRDFYVAQMHSISRYKKEGIIYSGGHTCIINFVKKDAHSARRFCSRVIVYTPTISEAMLITNFKAS